VPSGRGRSECRSGVRRGRRTGRRCPGTGLRPGGDTPGGGQGAARLHECPRPFREGGQAGAGSAGRQRTGPVPCPEGNR
jgi:hypothetical protein